MLPVGDVFSAFGEQSEGVSLTVSDLVVQTLKRAGVRRVYGIPGDSLNGFTDALYRDGTITGNGTLAEQRLYQLIRQPSPVAERRFEIEFLDSDVAAYDFTFG